MKNEEKRRRWNRSSLLNTVRRWPWTKVVRVLGLSITGIAIALSVAGIEPWYNTLRDKPLLDGCRDLHPDFSASFCATYIISWEILFAVAFFITATLLFWYRSDTVMAIVLAGTMVAVGTIGPGMTDRLIKTTPHTLLIYPIWFARAMASTCTLLLFYLLPDGKFIPSWTRITTIIWIFINIIWLFDPKLPASPIDGTAWRNNFAISLAVA
jgi:hypothetical protein